MTGWRLELREPATLPLDLSPLLPDAVIGRDEREVAAILLQHGNRQSPLGELFSLTSDTGLTLAGTTGACHGIGTGMASGTLRVEGDVGLRLGLGMTGGTIEVGGSAGALAGSGMKDGVIRVAGGVGDMAGGALPGDMAGMRGGALLVGGDAGDRVGDRMRRGLIAIAGRAGSFTASRMIGGTIIAAGSGEQVGYGMRRGTVVLGAVPPSILCTFADNGSLPLPWLRLLAAELDRLGRGFAPAVAYRRLTGCASAGGAGEILIAA